MEAREKEREERQRKEAAKQAKEEKLTEKQKQKREKKRLAKMFKPEEPWRVAIRQCLLDGYVPAAGAGSNMKNYVRKKKSLKGLKRFVEESVEIQTFEQRYNTDMGTYYLYNPYTGECITDIETADRRYSTWVLPDPHLDTRDTHGAVTVTHQLYPDWYASTHHKRKWERGKYATNHHAAAVLLCAAARGMIARRRMRQIHRERYHRVFDETHQCCYFIDLVTSETSWHKPLLAHPFSIQPPPPDIRDDQVESSAGPLFKKTLKGGRQNIPKQALELKQETALPTEREPDLPSLDSDYLFLSMWLDDNVKKLHKMQGIYKAYETWDWKAMLHYMLTYVDDELVQLFALHAIARMEVVMADGGRSKTKVDQYVRKVMNHLFLCVEAWGTRKKFGCNLLLSLHYALLHIFKNHLCRVEFFYGYESRVVEKAMKERKPEDIAAGRIALSLSDLEDVMEEDLDDVTEQEMQRRADAGIAEHIIETKMGVFCKLLKNIPVTISEEQHQKGSSPEAMGNITKVARPTQRAAEMVTIIMKIMGVLAHERDPRESIGAKCGPWIPKTLRLCKEEPYVVQFGLRCLYNFMYMCFQGWRWVHMECDAVELVKEIKVGPLNGDEGVIREIRRVELSLETDGWRGKVEEQIEKEMQENDISIYLHKKNSPDVSPIKEVELTEEELRVQRKEAKMRKRYKDRQKTLRKGEKSGLVSALHAEASRATLRLEEDEESLAEGSVASMESQMSDIPWQEDLLDDTYSPQKKQTDGPSALLAVE